MPTTPRPSAGHSWSTDHPGTGPASRRAGRGARARRAAAASGTVLLLGATTVALSACRSSSSADNTSPPTSSTVAKQAGVGLDVHLTIVNRTYQSVDVDLCGENMEASMNSDTCEKHTLGPMHRSWPIDGTWNTADQIRYGAVQGMIRFSPEGVTFEAFNPAISRPGFRLASAADFTPEKLEDARKAGSPPGYEPFAHDPKADDGTSTEDLRFDEQQTVKYTMNGHALQLERLDDDTWKELKITILPLGG